jgi:hypothetical protein
MASIPACVYIAEMADRSLRGMLVTWPSIGISVGILVVYTLGAFFKDNWRLVAAISGGFPVFTAVTTLVLLPESPLWALSKGRGSGMQLTTTPMPGPEESNPSPRKIGVFRTLTLPQAWKPLFILNGFFFFQQFSGIFVIIFYAVTVAKEAGVNFDNYLAAVFIGVNRLVVTIVISFASRRYGRRILCNVSGVWMTLSLVGLTLYLTLTHDHILTDDAYGWWPIMALVMYIISSTVGFLTLPWAMIGEVFPVRIRGPATGVTTCMAYLFSFVVLKMYPEMKHMWGNHGLFTFYSTIALAGTICMYVYLPETRDRTLHQIEEHFRGKV